MSIQNEENHVVEDPFYTKEIKALPIPEGCTQLVVGRGSKTPTIVFIGEAPGKTEDKTGQPFVGRSGQLLDEWILDWDLTTTDYAILNTVKFFPQDESGNPRPPTEKEKDEWRPILKRQLAALNPKLIVALGATAKTELTDNTDPQMEASGKSYPLRHYYGLDIPVFVLPHPAMYLRNGRDRDYYTKAAFQFIHKILNKPKLLIVDIETDSLDIKTAKVKLMGYYSYHTQEYGILGDTGSMQAVIDAHSHLITFNGKEFDLPILKMNGVNSQGKIVIDLLRGLKARGRRDVMGLKDLPDNKLATLVKFWGLGEKKELDYNLLKKSMWTEEEHKHIIDYTLNDIKITKKVFDKWATWAEPFAPYISAENQWKMTHLVCSVASYSYKAICHATGRLEDYLDEEDLEGEEEEFEGGFVSADVEMVRDNVLLFDFASLYPHNFIQANLFSPSSSDYKGPIFEANDFYPDLQGKYKADDLGSVEAALEKFYKLRQEYKKKKDPREYALKIVLNSSYGAGTCKTFKSIYNPTVGPDTTYIGRQNIKYVRKMLSEAGFQTIYTDTDSIYVHLGTRSKEEVVKIIKDAVEHIKKFLPFPRPTFRMDLQAEIAYFQTFRSEKTGRLLKKFYLYVTTEGKLTIKGLPFIKSNATQLGKRVFERLRPEIIGKLDCKFPEKKLEDIMREEVEHDRSVAAKLFAVKDPGRYKIPGQLECQLARRYGEGKYLMVKNKVFGIGKDIKYCTIDEAKNLTYEQLDLSTTRNELHFFIKPNELEAFV